MGLLMTVGQSPLSERHGPIIGWLNFKFKFKSALEVTRVLLSSRRRSSLVVTRSCGAGSGHSLAEVLDSDPEPGR